MPSARAIAEQFLDAFYGGDLETARKCLKRDVSVVNPAATFQTAEQYLAVAGHAAAAKAVEKRKVFVDDHDVCIFYDLILDHPVGKMSVAEWYQVDGDQIASIRMIFDTGPFVSRSHSDDVEVAIDPVCHMSVSREPDAITRVHEGETYYFCNPGCAARFEKEPEKFLAPVP